MPTILFVAGDLSGDCHAAMLARELAAQHPEYGLFAVGGDALKSCPGMTMVGDTTGCGVMGLGPALQLVPRLKKLQRDILDFLARTPIDLVVLLDWGGFNGRLLPHLKALGIPVLYYFPPRSWQKKGEGGTGIAPYVARVATPFPWSAEKLQAAGCNAEWVGHPLLETLKQARSRAELRQEFGATDTTKLVALLPGSRSLELRYNAANLAGAARGLRQSRPDIDFKFVVAVTRGAAARVRPYFEGNFHIVEGRAAEALLACDAAAVKSGTITLEAAIAGAPQVVVYNVPAVMVWQWHLMGGRRKIPFVAMPNIILGRLAITELLGHEGTPAAINAELQKLLFDAAARQKLQDGYTEVRRALGAELPLGATERTAQIVSEMLAERVAA